jgi:hypothetical protein
MTTGKRGFHCHALTILQLPGKLVPQNQRMLELCVTDSRLGEPVQVRTAHSYCFDADQFLFLSYDRGRFLMDL